MKTPLEMIAEERQRQIERWGNSHDDEHDEGQLAKAAASYALFAGGDKSADREWPFEIESYNPGIDPVRALVKAAAMIVAEIERLQRL